MCGMTRRAVRAAAGVVALSLMTAAVRAEPAATGVRIGVSPPGTRFVVDLTESVPFTIYTMRDPYRVVVDLPELAWQVEPSAAKRHGGLIEGFRFGLLKAGTFRIVLDVNQPVAVRNAFLLLPSDGHQHRFVLDIAAISQAEFDRSYVGPPPVAAAPVAAAPATAVPVAAAPVAPPTGKPPRTEGRHIVVIDPGHGGIDPGATGVSGTQEKDITLAAAKELKRELENGGRYQIVLTRERDVFLPLRERVQVARNAHAQLFISLHADTIATRGITGSSVYTLSEKASDAEAAAIAAHENKADVIAGADLNDYPEEVAGILVDLAQRETKNDSIRYAHLLTEELDKSGRVLEHGMRSAGFAVLKAPDVPSVLLEMGYLSDPKEERDLRDARYRAKLMAAVKRAVDAYFAELDRSTKS